MIVRMKTTSAGPNGSRYAGKEYPVTAEEGRALVEGGFAVWVDAPAREIKVATLPAPENAALRVKPIARKRAGK